jgi:putative transposase
MSQSLSNIILHIVFSTRNREPCMDADTQQKIYAYFVKAFADHKCPVYEIGGTNNHIHIACSFSRTLTVSDLIRDVKISSTKWIKEKTLRDFSWQRGYGVFSVSQSQLNKLENYIQTQEEHHRQKSFKQELLELLQKHHISYDENYLWD